ncbi:MAG TPA: peptide chain release factor N(5)-glutamine methyltransferase [Blastocatellia bacterium]|nr:peptide chain release factor N(5)-glutamine methyltransferase [Blastocatellia bacterium]
MPTIAEAIAEGSSRLEGSAVGEPRRTAGVLLCHLLGIERTHLLTRSEQPVKPADYDKFLRLIERRSAGEPTQYITGHQEFYGLDFIVSPDVLIPRPETEFLVERVIELAGVIEEERPLIVDVGTGSGCIAVAVAVRVPRARLIATDVSEAALEVARRNAERNGVRDRIEFLAGELLTPLAGKAGAVDILASNPPYVNEGRPELIQREVRDWEPRIALFGGGDGLEFYRRLLAEGSELVKPGGFLVVEIGYSQFEAIEAMIAGSSWELVDVTRDLQGIPRTITVRRPSENGPGARLRR